MSGSTTDVIIKTYPKGTVERAQHRDLRSINDLVYAAYHPYIPRLNGKSPAPMTADYDLLIAARKLFVLRPTSTAANTPKEIVGCVSFNLDTATQALMINNVAVHPAAQGKGYGKLLMKFSEDLAGMLGCKRSELYTNVKMVENIGLYGKMGYVEVGRWEEEGFERVFMRKDFVWEAADRDGEDANKVEELKRDLVVSGDGEGEEAASLSEGAGSAEAKSDAEQVAQLRAQLGELGASRAGEKGGRWGDRIGLES